jgi:nucleoside-diphosphate-sugar epimerase
MKIKILGGSGFIGSHLNTNLESCGYEIFKLLKNQKLDVQKVKEWREISSSHASDSRVIVNLAGAWRNCSHKEIIEANFIYPSRILSEEIRMSGPLVWIQASSYFQLFNRFYGVHKDLYSQSKYDFSTKLKRESEQNDNLKVIDVFLPHTIGPGEPAERIFPMLAGALLNNKILDLTSGTSIMPVLDVRDLVNELTKLISTHAEVISNRYSEIYPRVSGVMSLRSHIENILDNPDKVCRFNILEDRENEFIEAEQLEEYYKVNSNFLNLSDSFRDLIEHR